MAHSILVTVFSVPPAFPGSTGPSAPVRRSTEYIDRGQVSRIGRTTSSEDWVDHEVRNDGAPLRGSSVDCCPVQVGHVELLVQGNQHALQRLFLPPSCPLAREMGYWFVAHRGDFVLQGEICGDQTVAAGGGFLLDPQRLADAGEWNVVGPDRADESNPRWGVRVRKRPDPRFVLQRYEPHAEPHGLAASRLHLERVVAVPCRLVS